MQPSQHADQPTDVGTVDDLISEAYELRGRVDAVRRETAPESVDLSGRWQRALCDLAVHHLRDLGEHLGQLRAEIAPGGGSASDISTEAGTGGTDAADAADADADLSRFAELGRAGSAEWNLVTDEVHWSEEMFRIFGRNEADGPLTLDELSAWLSAEDQGPVATLVTACLVDGKPIDGEFRIVRPDGSVRTVHMVGEPVLDTDGSTLSMWAVIRDVSRLRRSQRAVRETRETLRRSRHVARTEHRMAVKLQEAVLPPWLGPIAFPRHGPQVLDLDARYLPCATSSLIGGDWYDALELPDGTTLLTVGDLTGRGVPATSGMATMLGALRGMALAGVQPGPMMGLLNQLLDRTAHPALGSALCGRFDPVERTLTWARAGHPAPLLYRDGGARALDQPEGQPADLPEGGLLGATPDARYGQRTERLAPGDVLILHTAGLLPRRDAHTAAGVRRMTALAPRIAAAGSARDCVRVVVEEFGAPERDDDACVLAARIC